MKGMYQVDLTLGGAGPQQVRGVDMRTSNLPSRVAFDEESLDFYWHDSELDGPNTIKRMSQSADGAEHSLTILDHGTSQM